MLEDIDQMGCALCPQNTRRSWSDGRPTFPNKNPTIYFYIGKIRREKFHCGLYFDGDVRKTPLGPNQTHLRHSCSRALTYGDVIVIRYVLWAGFGLGIRNGTYSNANGIDAAAIKRAIPQSLQTILDYAKLRGVKLMVLLI